MVELSQQHAGVLLLIGAAERHAELKQFAGGLRSFSDNAV